MSEECICNEYGDLPLEMTAIEQREKAYSRMRPKLRQLSQKVIERWYEHYRLYKCDVCGQYWQSSISPGIEEGWYLFKVPKISVKAWKEQPYVAPGFIVQFLEQQKEYLSKKFETQEKTCNEVGCDARAMTGALKCQYHQFVQLSRHGTMRESPSGRWFSPYQPDLLKPKLP